MDEDLVPTERETRPPSDPANTVSRRRLLLGAGGVAAAGAVAGAAGGTVAPTTAEASEGALAISRKGTTAFELVGRVLQNGDQFDAYAYLTRVAGIDDAELFEGGEQSEATALLTIVGHAQMVSRSVRPNVFVLDAVGELVVHRQEEPGADFASPASFADGPEVARFDVSLQDILTVIAPNEGIPTLAGDLRQTSGSSFDLAGRRRRFGHRGLLLRLTATGHGVRSNPDPPVAQLELGGHALTAG